MGDSSFDRPLEILNPESMFTRNLFLFLAIYSLSHLLEPSESAADEEDAYDRGKRWAAFVEPMGGIGVGFYGNDTSNALGSNQIINGLTLFGPKMSLRGGALYDYYFFGAEMEYAMMLNSTLPKAFTELKLDVFVGYTMPEKPFRFWISIAFLDALNTGTQTLQADSFKMGAGYFIQKQISLNLEVDLRSYGKVNSNSVSITPSLTSVLLTASFPFTFWTQLTMGGFSYQRMKESESESGLNGLF